ncbi:MAG: hypothetical protein LBF22_14205, partial [Deltaproteobacteria bacterium]|nr:hypothetical protein [Deltaproteobacteria bacterium]
CDVLSIILPPPSLRLVFSPRHSSAHAGLWCYKGYHGGSGSPWLHISLFFHEGGFPIYLALSSLHSTLNYLVTNPSLPFSANGIEEA